LRTTVIILSFLTLVAVPLVAPSASGMAVMQYYVGSWSCLGGPIGVKPVNASVTYTLDDGVMREWVHIAPAGEMKRPYVLNATTTFDAKNQRYVQAGLDSDAAWWISYAQPFSGDIERWTEHETSTGKLGRSETTRTSQAAFTFLGYQTYTATRPNFRITCKRS
jgi:hypothetical protein